MVNEWTAEIAAWITTIVGFIGGWIVAKIYYTVKLEKLHKLEMERRVCK